MKKRERRDIKDRNYVCRLIGIPLVACLLVLGRSVYSSDRKSHKELTDKQIDLLKSLGPSSIDPHMPEMNARADSLSRVAEFQPRLISIKASLLQELQQDLILFHGQTPDRYNNVTLDSLNWQYKLLLDSLFTPSSIDTEVKRVPSNGNMG